MTFSESNILDEMQTRDRAHLQAVFDHQYRKTMAALEAGGLPAMETAGPAPMGAGSRIIPDSPSDAQAQVDTNPPEPTSSPSDLPTMPIFPVVPGRGCVPAWLHVSLAGAQWTEDGEPHLKCGKCGASWASVKILAQGVIPE